MLKFSEELLINQFAQNLLSINFILEQFDSLDLNKKRDYLDGIIYLIQQSKPKSEDIQAAITNSGLKSSYTPCVMIKKGVESYHLQKIVLLPENELNKTFVLFLNLFKVAYLRRYEKEKNNPDKWWYWDFSDNKLLKKVNLIVQKIE